MLPKCDVDHPLSFREHVERLRNTDGDLAQQVAGLQTIDQVLAWMQRQQLANAAVDLIAQDEFSYDFLIQLEPSRWIVFGVT